MYVHVVDLNLTNILRPRLKLTVFSSSLHKCVRYTKDRGYARFVNIRDGRGATPLHLAARQCHPACVHALLDSEALVCASTGGYGYSIFVLSWVFFWVIFFFSVNLNHWILFTY